jgi:hypothetical protein
VTDTLNEDHAQAGLALLAANATLTVYDGQVPNGATAPYVLVYTQVEWQSGDDAMANTLDHLSLTCRTTWMCHCVGSTAAAARAVAMQVREAILDARPTITGREAGFISQVDSQPPRRDETLGPLVMDQVDTYQLLTAPGA